MYRIQKRLLILFLLLGLTALFTYKVPVGKAVTLKTDIKMFPGRIGEWSGYDISLSDDNIPLDTPLTVDEYIYRKYRDSKGRTVFLYIGYLEKFRHNDSIFAGSYVNRTYGLTLLKEREEIENIGGETIRIKEAVLKNERECFPISYWYHTNRGIITDRDNGRLYHAIDAILNKKTNVAFIRLSSNSQISGGCEFSMDQKLLVREMVPYLQKFLPFEMHSE